MKRLLYLLLPLMFLTWGCSNDESDDQPIDPDYVMPDFSGKKVGLVLSGGGAKGAAEIGALKVIESHGIKIDFISGTSIGSVVGSLYAAGYTPAELEEVFVNLDADEAKNSSKIRDIIDKLLKNKGVTTFADLNIPFRCVAADAKELKEVVLSEGSVLDAVMASSAIPYVYDNVVIDNHIYVDGGFYNNLPVDVAENMGAEFTIVVDLRQEGESFFPGKYAYLVEGITLLPDVAKTTFGDAAEIVMDYCDNRPDLIKYENNVKNAGIYIHPKLSGYDALSFGADNCKAMVKAGEDAANARIK